LLPVSARPSGSVRLPSDPLPVQLRNHIPAAVDCRRTPDPHPGKYPYTSRDRMWGCLCASPPDYFQEYNSLFPAVDLFRRFAAWDWLPPYAFAERSSSQLYGLCATPESKPSGAVAKDLSAWIAAGK